MEYYPHDTGITLASAGDIMTKLDKTSVLIIDLRTRGIVAALDYDYIYASPETVKAFIVGCAPRQRGTEKQIQRLAAYTAEAIETAYKASK